MTARRARHVRKVKAIGWQHWPVKMKRVTGPMYVSGDVLRIWKDSGREIWKWLGIYRTKGKPGAFARRRS